MPRRVPAGGHDGGDRPDRRCRDPRPGREAGFSRLPGLPEVHLRLDQRGGRPRHPVPQAHPQGGRHRGAGSRRDRGRLFRRRGPHGDPRAGAASGPRPRHDDARSAPRRNRGDPRRRKDRGHRRGRRVGRAKEGIRHRPRVRRTRDRHVAARSAAGPQLRPGRPARDDPRGNDAGHRADVQPRGAKVVVDDDGWTVRAADGKPSAHFEHTVVATADGPVVLGFGRYAEDRAIAGAPSAAAYPEATGSGLTANVA